MNIANLWVITQAWEEVAEAKRPVDEPWHLRRAAIALVRTLPCLEHSAARRPSPAHWCSFYAQNEAAAWNPPITSTRVLG